MPRRDDNAFSQHDIGMNTKTREVFLHHHIPEPIEDDELNFKSAVTCIKNLLYLDSLNTEQIILHIHSTGGSWYDGMAIYDTITCLESHVVGVGYGIVASMASIIMQAVDVRVLTKNADMLLHYGYVGLDDTYQAVKSAVDHGEKLRNTMMSIYLAKCQDGKYFKELEWSPKQIKAFLTRQFKNKSDWYLTAQEAVKYGLADYILGQDFKSIREIRAKK